MEENRAPVTVAVADDDPIVRDLVKRLLQRSSTIIVVGEAADGREAIALCDETHPDILLLDLLMPHLPGIDALRELTSRNTPVRPILVCSFIGKRQVLQALQLGARGILLKRAVDRLPAAIAAVMAGRYWIEDRDVAGVEEVIGRLASATASEARAAEPYGLTRRELEILSFVTLGRTNREIGQSLNISEETVKRHLVNIFDKTGMSTRLEVAMLAVDRRLVAL